MVVKHKLKMDLAELSQLPEVNVVHRDQFSRKLVVELYECGEPWMIPETVSVIIRYVRDDGTGGSYDTLPDGTKAWTAQGNTLTMELSPHLMEFCGPVMLAADLLQGESKLSTFRILMFIRETVPCEDSESADYFRISRFLPFPESALAGQMLQVGSVDEKGNVTSVRAVDLPEVNSAIEAALLAAKESGEFKGASAYEIAVANGFEGTEAEWVASLNRPASGSWGRVVAQNLNVTGKFSTDNGITVNFAGNRLQGVLDPVNVRDAANKQYVDDSVRGYAVPQYWNAAVEEAIAKVNAAQDAGGAGCVTFAWFSDLHMDAEKTVNSGHTGALAAAVMDACHIPIALMCGDGGSMTEALQATRDSAMQNLLEADRNLAPIGKTRLLRAAGGYDGAWGTGFSGQLSVGELYNALFRPQSTQGNRVFGGDGSCFYVDIPHCKLRFIVLNSCWVADGTGEDGAALHSRVSDFGFGNAQLNWLASQALRFEEAGWAVVIASHAAPNHSALRDGSVLRGILSAFVNKTAYSGSYGTAGQWDAVSVSCSWSGSETAQLVGWFAGCTHADTLDTATLPYPVITIASDGILSSEGRSSGSNTEHILDFVTVNRDASTVTLSRLGAGMDRSYSYGSV